MGRFDFYEWWAGLEPPKRYGVAMVILLIAAALWYFEPDVMHGWVPLSLVGLILLLFAGRFHWE